MVLANRILIILFSSILVLACRDRENVSRKDFATLSEDDRRLPDNALLGMQVLDGYEVELFASEPLITNPTNISVDHMGRVWVCEAYNYDVSPEQADNKGDRIVVLEDTDHNGRADKRTVFYQGTDINTPLGIFVSGDDVYVSRSPHVFIFSDTNRDLVADRKDTLFTNLGNKGDHSAHSIFPGPDGKLYFSTGNMAGEIRDKHGNPIKDRAGYFVNQKGTPYLGGMIMRFDREGKHVEVLGHNFRNNYEPCIDSYGNMWQSDNDDDGNESCRINYIIPFGNYGYVDEFTRASWSTNRVGLEKNISERHWHQSDPGVIPNVLITGAGSPAGMTVYEGTMLPKEFVGAPVHAEPYYNVVRAYLPEKVGAGYSAVAKEILKSQDQWFRPVDVATAPDGSLFVADWYDAILGGGAAVDAQRGRIYRVAKNTKTYNPPVPDLKTIEGNVEALKNPNIELRDLAMKNLISRGDESVPALENLWRTVNSTWRIRAFWTLLQLNKGDTILAEAMEVPDANIRLAAIRAVLQYKSDPVPFLRKLARDPDPHVIREVATALRYSGSREAAELWVELASQYDGNDRWFLEALGIGSDLHADLYFQAWVNSVKVDLNNKSHRDILWRLRSKGTLPYLRDIISNSPTVESTLPFFRSFDFHREPEKNDVLLSLLEHRGRNAREISALALQQVDAEKIRRSKRVNEVLAQTLRDTYGTAAYVDIARKFNLREKSGELIKMALSDPGTDLSNAAIDQVIRFKAYPLLKASLQKDDSSALALLTCLRGKGNREVLDLVVEVIKDPASTLTVRQTAMQTLGSSWPGEERLLALVKHKSFPAELKPVAASILFNVYRSSIQREAANYLEAPTTNGSQLPTIKELVASKGNHSQGVEVFTKYCASCHRAGNNGIKFGPELSLIGSKLSKDGLYRAILYPDEGISHGFGSVLVTLKDGTQSVGILTNETDAEVELSLPGGAVNTYSREQISKIDNSQHSIMPTLASSMSKQELIDLVAYLSTLKD